MNRCFALLAACFPVLCNAANTEWTLARSQHFEVYSQAGERDGRSALLWFEQLRAFFLQSTFSQLRAELDTHAVVRVIRFGSRDEYAAYRLQPAADAYFLAAEGRDYIVMPALGSEGFNIAAHEYAHMVLHSLRRKLPPWLAEGIAEFFSSVQITERQSLIGGDLPMRTLVLRRRPWIPLDVLLGLAPVRLNRNEADIFYAESWAFTSMLMLSPAYAPRFTALIDALGSGTADAATLTQIYGKPLSAITTDLRARVQKARAALSLPGVPSVDRRIEISGVNGFDSRLMLADLSFASGDLKRAEAAYKALQSERPEDPVVAAALGSIAVRGGDPKSAREQFKHAIELQTHDASLCYRYAILAQDAGFPPDEIAKALHRAIELQPDFDDARYQLGLLENNRGHYEAALEQFRAMRRVPDERAYGYWTAMASALTEMDQREEAKEAAAKAVQHAANAEQRTFASQLAYAAATDLTVQFSRDAHGNLQMVTARKPHGSDDWNPFIEPGDHIVSLVGRLSKVECDAGKITGFRVESASVAVEVTLPDPTHVLIRGGTPEFVCGAEDGRKVAIQYAASHKQATAVGVLRGMEFQ